jgi:protein tyrosine/serine phosphatase
MSSPSNEAAALRQLQSDAGPVRFACVAPGVYRGGQPDHRQLAWLRDLGVRSTVNLRRERRSRWRQEESDARDLGLRFVHYPFYGIFGAAEPFLLSIVDQLRAGHVYVHCKHGRDRTSLVVALYRVIVDGWDANEAWEREALAYGSADTYFYRQLRVVFDRMTSRYVGARPVGELGR